MGKNLGLKPRIVEDDEDEEERDASDEDEDEEPKPKKENKEILECMVLLFVFYFSNVFFYCDIAHSKTTKTHTHTKNLKTVDGLPTMLVRNQFAELSENIEMESINESVMKVVNDYIAS